LGSFGAATKMVESNFDNLAYVVVTPPVFFIVSIVLRIVFPLLPIVLAQAAFLSPLQSLTLQTTRFFHCRSPVFFFSARGARSTTATLPRFRGPPTAFTKAGAGTNTGKVVHQPCAHPCYVPVVLNPSGACRHPKETPQ
jgi:hypothetical protein